MLVRVRMLKQKTPPERCGRLESKKPVVELEDEDASAR